MQPPVDDGMGNPMLRMYHPMRIQRNEKIQYYACACPRRRAREGARRCRLVA